MGGRLIKGYINMVYGLLKLELAPFLYGSLIAEAVVTVLIMILFFRIHGIKTFKPKCPML